MLELHLDWGLVKGKNDAFTMCLPLKVHDTYI